MYYSKAIVAGSSTAPTETTKRHQMIGTDLVQFILIFANLKGGLSYIRGIYITANKALFN